MKIPKKIATLLTVTLVAASGMGNQAEAASSQSLVGQGRWETAIKISNDGWSSASEAVIVNDSSIVDALSATPFAQGKDAPILLTQKNKLDSRTKSELKRLKVKKVYLIGGESVLNKDVENQLKAEGITTERIWGDDRYKTSLALAKKVDDIKAVSQIAVVNGAKGLADAVSIGGVAAQNNMPIVLVDPVKGTEVADKFIKDKSISNTYIIGGYSVVSSDIEKKLPNTKRLSGSDRNETNAKVIEEFYKDTDLKNAYITKDGMQKEDQLIDSLAVGVLAAKKKSPVVLAGSKLHDTQKRVLNTKNLSAVTQVGGNGNEKAFKELKDLQTSTKYEVSSVKALNDAIAKADACDVIEFDPSTSTISDDITINTDKAITVVFEDAKYYGDIEIDMPNGDVKNYGVMDDLDINDVKNGTFTNYGQVKVLRVYDKNGCSIVNSNDGEIDSMTIASTCGKVMIDNNGEITKLKNDSKDTDIDNDGKIGTLIGSQRPSISGNKPGSTDINSDDKLSKYVDDVNVVDNDTIEVTFDTKMSGLSFWFNGDKLSSSDIDISSSSKVYTLDVDTMLQGEYYDLEIRKSGYDDYEKSVVYGESLKSYLDSSSNGTYTLDQDVTIDGATLRRDRDINFNGYDVTLRGDINVGSYKITTSTNVTGDKVRFYTGCTITGSGNNNVVIDNLTYNSKVVDIELTNLPQGYQIEKNKLVSKRPITVSNVQVINQTTVKVTMPNLDGLTFKWNDGVLSGNSVSAYTDGGYTLTVPNMTAGKANSLRVEKLGYSDYLNSNIYFTNVALNK